jgi:hypothetical protein
MIYAPQNFRVVSGFALFVRDDERVTAIRMSTIESLSKQWIPEAGTWEIKVYLATGKRYTFEFSSLGNVFDNLLGA